MTWKDFKLAVDKHLAENELSEDIEIGYIDIGTVCSVNAMEINTLRKGAPKRELIVFS